MKPGLSLGGSSHSRGRPVRSQGARRPLREDLVRLPDCFLSFLCTESCAPERAGCGGDKDQLWTPGWGDPSFLCKMESSSLLPQTQPLPPFRPLPRARKIPERKWVLWATRRKRGFNCHLVPGGLSGSRQRGKCKSVLGREKSAGRMTLAAGAQPSAWA